MIAESERTVRLVRVCATRISFDTQPVQAVYQGIITVGEEVSNALNDH